jgi:hypothetical protein
VIDQAVHRDQFIRPEQEYGQNDLLTGVPDIQRPLVQGRGNLAEQPELEGHRATIPDRLVSA